MKRLLQFLLIMFSHQLPAQQLLIGGMSNVTIPEQRVSIVSCTPSFSYYVPGISSTGLTWDGTNLWTRSMITDSVYLNDPVTGNLTGVLAAPPSNGITLTGDIDFDGTYLWHVQEQAGLLTKMDPYTGQIIHQFALPNNNYLNPSDPNNWGIAYYDGSVWEAEYGSDIESTYMHKIDTANGMVIDSFLLQHAILPIKFINGELFGVAFDVPYVFKIDVNLKTVTDSFPRCVFPCYGITQNSFGFWMEGGSTANGNGIHLFGSLTAVEEPSQSPINIYPNPVSDFLNIRSDQREGTALVTFTDVTGRLIGIQNVNFKNHSCEVDFSSFSPGTYFIGIEMNDETKYTKIIKL